MPIGIIQFPGSNCERETMMAVKRAGMEPIEFLWNESPEKLRSFDGYIIVGGFSYEDRSRAGIIAALDPVMQEIRVQAESGKPILGICNGAQILVETGLVPGLENNKTAMVLTENKRVKEGKVLGTGYYNTWVHLRLSDNYQRNAFTRHLTPKNILHVPIAHGEGRFVMGDGLLQEVKNQGLNVFQYCDESGSIIDYFPVNPNGSTENIAAISNKAGNVMAIMPHPERTVNGDAIFFSMRDYIADKHREVVDPLYYYPRPTKMPTYQKQNDLMECIVELMITDNHALTVQNTLKQLGFPVTVTRQIHWEVQGASADVMQKIKASGVLYNDRKERVVDIKKSRQKNGMAILVRPKEDLLGLSKLQMLHDHYALQAVSAIKHGILWHFDAEPDVIKKILSTNIIANPYAHDCYEYHS